MENSSIKVIVIGLTSATLLAGGVKAYNKSISQDENF